MPSGYNAAPNKVNKYFLSQIKDDNKLYTSIYRIISEGGSGMLCMICCILAALHLIAVILLAGDGRRGNKRNKNSSQCEC